MLRGKPFLFAALGNYWRYKGKPRRYIRSASEGEAEDIILASLIKGSSCISLSNDAAGSCCSFSVILKKE